MYVISFDVPSPKVYFIVAIKWYVDHQRVIFWIVLMPKQDFPESWGPSNGFWDAKLGFSSP